MIHIFDRFTIDTEYWQNFVQQASPSQYCDWGRIPVRTRLRPYDRPFDILEKQQMP